MKLQTYFEIKCDDICRMKSLEEDAMRAQAVIAKVREMQDPDLTDIPGIV